MQLIRGLAHLEVIEKGCVLTMGNFDGIHLGHCEVIKKLRAQAEKMDLPAIVLLFEPQPLEFFLGENAPTRLTRLREKIIQFKALSIDKVLVLKFNKHLANFPAEAFIKEILVDKLNVKHLVIGDDFHFGKARRGNFSMLQEKGQLYGFKVEDTHSYEYGDMRISSTLIRDALGDGNLILAKQMLGRDYSVSGRVAHGDKRGRLLGFPTANIEMFRKNTPIEGVYAVTMKGFDDKVYQGVANVGSRPTINGDAKVILETHLFDFDREIYGAYVEVNFKAKIRDEKKFASLDALTAQIDDDVQKAKKIFQELQ